MMWHGFQTLVNGVCLCVSANDKLFCFDSYKSNLSINYSQEPRNDFYLIRLLQSNHRRSINPMKKKRETKNGFNVAHRKYFVFNKLNLFGIFFPPF